MHSRRSFTGYLLAAPLAAALPSDAADLTITEAVALLRNRKLTPVELTQACLQRIEKLNPKLNAIITILGDQALTRARSLQPGSAANQALHGVPLVLKDLFDLAGIRTTAASAQWRDRVPTTDAMVASLLQKAGCVVVGKANLDEFAYNFTSETSVFGASHNPWKHDCSPGGSSGGSAIAVSTGMCLGALGSDTGGSIRLPAAFCGITGYKPTYNSVPTAGAAPLSWSLDHIGPMTRTALDAGLLFEVLSGQSLQMQSANLFRVGIPRKPYWQNLDGDAELALRSAVSTIKQISREVRDVQLPLLPANPQSTLPTAYSTVIFTEAYAFHRKMLAEHPERYHPKTKDTLELGKSILGVEYVLARREMEHLRATASEALFKDADLLILPTAPGPAFKLGSDPSLIYLRNTAPWNLYGLPSISIPCGFSKSGLPIGLQIVGRPGNDAAVLSLAQGFQNDTDFHRRRPVLS